MHSDAVGVVPKAHDGCYLVISRFAESGESWASGRGRLLPEVMQQVKGKAGG